MDLKNKEIIIIGAGKVAWSVTSGLAKIDKRPGLIISRKLSSAKKLALKFGIKNYSDKLEIKKTGSLIFLLSVPDSEIEKTALEISTLKINHKKNFYIHFSGSEDLSPLSSLSGLGGNVGSFHLMQTFPARKAYRIKNSFVGLEFDNPKTKNLLTHLASRLQLRPVEIPKGGKSLYHLTGVFISNFLVSNFYLAEEIFEQSKIKGISPFEMLEPILHSTIANIKKSGVIESLSGPVQRGDFTTVQKHIQVLWKYPETDKINLTTLMSYLVQSLTLLKLLELKDGKLSHNHEQMLNLLRLELESLFI
ncbi:MAG: DUF2520 domain-containing protein [Ignavibacteriaceae bacterium]